MPDEKEDVIETIRKRIGTVVNKIKKQNINKLNFINDRISETDRILELVDTAIQGPDVDLITLKEAITELDRMSLEESSMIDATKNSSKINNAHDRSNPNDNVVSDFSEIVDNFNIQTNNEDTKLLINVISQQKTLLNFYALLTGLQINSRTNEKSKKSKIPSAYDNLAHKEYECTFLPAILDEMKKSSISLNGSFLLRHNENQGEIEYIPMRKFNTKDVGNRENEKLLKLLSEKCYFGDTKAIDFLFLLLQVFVKL